MGAGAFSVASLVGFWDRQGIGGGNPEDYLFPEGLAFIREWT